MDEEEEIRLVSQDKYEN